MVTGRFNSNKLRAPPLRFKTKYLILGDWRGKGGSRRSEKSITGWWEVHVTTVPINLSEHVQEYISKITRSKTNKNQQINRTEHDAQSEGWAPCESGHGSQTQYPAFGQGYLAVSSSRTRQLLLQESEENVFRGESVGKEESLVSLSYEYHTRTPWGNNRYKERSGQDLPRKGLITFQINEGHLGRIIQPETRRKSSGKGC